MRNFLIKTFGGLSKAYYFRQFCFALIFSIFLLIQSLSFLPMALLCQFLYPYSRFVYESIIDFIMGDNVVIMDGFVLLFWKIMVMCLCYIFSIFIAPIGLLYLYYYHSKNS